MMENTGRSDVVMHSNQHVQPSASLAARPSLVAYFGWVSNHGYNANERLGDRDTVIRDLLQDDNPVRCAGGTRARGCGAGAHPFPLTLPRYTTRPRQDTVYLLHKWGVRYVVTENVHRHDRPSERAWREAKAAAERGEAVEGPAFDADVYLNGAVTRVFRAGRFDVFRVTG
jgi:hypothetical protein